MDAPWEYMFPIDFQVTWSKVKVNWCPLNISGFSGPLCWQVANLVQWMLLGSRWPLLIFLSHCSRSNCWSLCNVLCSMSRDPFARKLPNLVKWMPLGSRWPLLIFWSHCQRSRSNCWSSSLVLSTQYLMNLTTLVDFREKINPGPLLFGLQGQSTRLHFSLVHSIF